MATRRFELAHFGSLVRRAQTSVRSFLEEWLILCEGRGLRPATVASYRVMIHLHVLPALGDAALVRVEPAHLNDLYHGLLRSGRKDGTGGLSARSVRYVHTILRKAFADAVRLGYVKVNPAVSADPPSARAARAPTLPVWGPEEVGQFLSAAERDPLYAAFYLAATTGLRRGELLGLRWCDLDLDQRQLHVVQTLIEVDHEPRVSPPKTERSRRVVALDAKTVGVLARHRAGCATSMKSCGRRVGRDDLVFTRADGSLIHPACFSYAFKRRVELAGVREIRLHDLRHTHATLALRAGIHPKVVSERLGHANVAITLDTYSHSVPALQSEAAEAIAALLPG